MFLINKNQNDIINSELINSYEIEYNFNDTPINRIKNRENKQNKQEMLDDLKKNLSKIENCELKKNATKLVLGEGDIKSPLMIIGEGPGQKEDQLGRPFVGDAGTLLNKMLNAIKVDRNKVYITNVVNYRPPNNRKPESKEILRYSNYLKKHILIINPKILILMGSTAMESLFGFNIKISKERGFWKEVIINQKTFLAIITFHPAYLLRQPEQKKYSWKDLKIIRSKIDELGIII